MSYKTVCVAGGGVLGSQIAFQAAYCGFDVTIWLRSEGSIGRTQPKIDHVREEYIAAIEGMADGTGEWCAGIADSGQPFDKEAAFAAVERAYSTLKLELDLAKAVADATWSSSLWPRTPRQRSTSTKSSPRFSRKRPSS